MNYASSLAGTRHTELSDCYNPCECEDLYSIMSRMTITRRFGGQDPPTHNATAGEAVNDKQITITIAIARNNQFSINN